MRLTEHLGDAWTALRSLKRAISDPARRVTPVRIGSPPGGADDDLRLLSAAGEFYKNYTHLEPDRIAVYSDMDEMYLYVLIYSALEAYVEEATQENPRSGLSVWPKSNNPEVQAHITRLFEQMEIEDRVEADIWQFAKYGDMFGLLNYDKNHGVFDMIPLEPRLVHRHESEGTRVLQGFSMGDTPDTGGGEGKKTRPHWLPHDLVHFRMRSKRASDTYGSPFFMQLRLTYKVLKLMEEQMTIYRMNMHPDRLFFKIMTGNMGPDERNATMRAWKRSMETLSSTDHLTGKFFSEFAPWLATGQNIYFPVGANDQVSGVEKLAGSANSGDIFDVEYMRDLLFAGMRVPKGFMGFEDTQGYRGTDTLSAQSIKFSRNVRRLQRYLMQGYVRLCRIHLAIHHIDSRQPKNEFWLEMSPVNYLDEAHKAELYAKRSEAMGYMLDIGDRLEQGLGSMNKEAWVQYVMKEFGGFDDAMISTLMGPAPNADLTYMPSGSRLTFEGATGTVDLSEDDRKRVRDIVMEDSTLREVLATDLTIASGLDSIGVSRYSSSMDSRLDLSTGAVFGAEAAKRQKRVEEAIQQSHEEAVEKPKRLKRRREDELKALAEHYKALYGEGHGGLNQSLQLPIATD